MDPGVVIKLHVEPEEQPPELAVCPLCRAEFEAAFDDAKAICPGCGLGFVPVPPAPEEILEGPFPAEVRDQPPLSADPLDRWLQGAPIQPREITDAEWLRNWARRHWLTTGLAGGAACVLVMAALASFSAWLHASWRLHQAVAARDKADVLRQDAEAAQADSIRRLEHQVSLRKSEQSLRRRLERELDAARQAADEAEGQRQLAESALQQSEREVRAEVARRLATRSELVRAEHPEHSLLLAAEALNLTQRNGEAPIASAAQYLRDRLGANDGRDLRGHGGKITALAISRNSRWLATASIDNTTRLWDLKSDDPAARPVVLTGHDGRVSAAAFSPDDRWLATGSYDSTICLWNLAAPDPAADPLTLRGHEGRITSLAISSNARWLFAASSGYNKGESQLRVWDLAAAEPSEASRALPGHGDRVQALAISRDDRWLATIGDDGMLRLGELTADGPAPEPMLLQGYSGRLGTLTFSADGRWLAAAESGSSKDSGGPWLWDLRAGERPRHHVQLSMPAGAIRALAASADGRWLVAGTEQGVSYLWDLSAPARGNGCLALRAHRGAVHAACFSADHRWLATAGADQSICLWPLNELSADATPIMLHANQGAVDSLATSRDGRWLASAGEDGVARIWNLHLEGLITLALQSSADPSADEQASIESSPRRPVNMANRTLHLTNPHGEFKLQR